MKQQTFNKIITVTLFTYFLVMYTVAWWIGKPLDFVSALVLAVPTINHIVHQLTDSSVTTERIKSDKDVRVAEIQVKNGVNNSGSLKSE